MYKSYKSNTVYLVLITIIQICRSQKVEGPPKLLDSFIPASMQVMAHLTELMKYEVKPTQKPYPTYSTTQRPTSSHKPAIYAPLVPPGPDAYFAKGLSYEEYVKRLQNPTSVNYFDRYLIFDEPQEENIQNTRSLKSKVVSSRSIEVEPQELEGIELYFGKKFSETLNLANYIENNFKPKDTDVQVQEFSQTYDDSDFRFELLRQKRVPPTKAYVTLLSLYDLMNKESKRLGLNKYGGYTVNVFQELVESSSGTSAHQLRYIMNRIVERQDTKKPEIITKVKKLIEDLDEDKSYINEALRYIPTLAYVP